MPHFHVVFTLLHEYLPVWRYNEALFARILFKASQETLQQLLAQQRHGGVTPEILMALHTWDDGSNAASIAILGYVSGFVQKALVCTY